jgi:dsDNA-specific endonuclease/ATPase MutS2
MFTLTKEEVEKLLTHADPAVVAATKKLIAVEEAGEFVPKSRLTQETKEAKELREKLESFEKAQKQTEEDRLKKSGEYEKLLDEEKKAHLKTQQERDEEKKLADELRKLRTNAIESYKKKLGDKWDDSYMTLPLEALAKIAGQEEPIIPTAKGAGKPPESDTFTRDEVKAHEGDKAWMTANFEKVQKSISSWGK